MDTMTKNKSKIEFSFLKDQIKNYDLFLFDLWGVIVEGKNIYPGVVDGINHIIDSGKKVVFLSNAPQRELAKVETLSSWGLNNISEEMLLTAGGVASRIIKNIYKESQKKQVVYHLQDKKDDEITDERYCILTDNIDEADILLLSLHRDEGDDLEKYNSLFEQAGKNEKLITICANPDTTIPNNGVTRYCAGYFAEISERYGCRVIYTGKPHSIIYDQVFDRYPEIKRERILMIGDTFETDVAGANDSLIHSALVLTGNSRKFHEKHSDMEQKLESLAERSNQVGFQPTFVTSLSPETAK